MPSPLRGTYFVYYSHRPGAAHDHEICMVLEDIPASTYLRVMFPNGFENDVAPTELGPVPEKQKKN